MTDPQLAALLADGVPSTPPSPPTTPHAVEVYPYERRRSGERHTVRLVLRTLTPVVAADGVLSNVILSREAVPGTASLSTILSHLKTTSGGTVDSRDQIGLADIRVGDAVPAVGDPRDPTSVTPALPGPMVWHRSDKGRGHSVFNTLSSEAPREQRAKPMSGWIAPDGNGRTLTQRRHTP